MTRLVLFAFVIAVSSAGLSLLACGNVPSASVSSTARTTIAPQQRLAVANGPVQQHGPSAIERTFPWLPHRDGQQADGQQADGQQADGQQAASTTTSNDEGTAQAEAVLRAFFRAWEAKDLAAYKALLSTRRLQEMNLGDWTFAGIDRVEFGPVIPAPEVIDLSIATYGYPYRQGNAAKEDLRCFCASIAWHYKPGVEGPSANGEELPWLWFLVRGPDSRWQVDDWGA